VLLLQFIDGLVLVPPDYQSHPMRDILHVEGLQGVLLPVLMEDEEAKGVLQTTLWLLRRDLPF
jgi:hypothetical protein